MAGKSGFITTLTRTRIWDARSWLAGAVVMAVAPLAAHAVSAMAPSARGSAAEVVEFLPQGTVSPLESVQVRFGQAVVSFGDTSAVAPFILDCTGPVTKGQGRWLDDTRWTYIFESPVPAGVSCVAEPAKDFRDLAGQLLPASARYEFNTGTPSVLGVRPHPGWDIDEEQAFILQFNGPVESRDVAKHSYCVVEGVGERIPVQAVGDEHRQALMEAAYMWPVPYLSHVAVLQCARALAPEAAVRLEVGPGIRAVGQAPTLTDSGEPYVLHYDVRAPFTARLSCTRERAGHPCLPITPIAVTFSAGITPDMAGKLRLYTADTAYEAAPLDDTTNEITSVRFPGPFPAGATLTLSLPEGLLDDAGRVLENADRFPMPIPLAEYPPLAKFASGTFGVIERFADRRPGSAARGASRRTAASSDSGANLPMVPVTLRNIEAQAELHSVSRTVGRVTRLRTLDDSEVLRWYARLLRLDSGQWTEGQLADIMADRKLRDVGPEESRIDARGVSMLSGQTDSRRLILPPPDEGSARPFEVVGIPLEQPGFHVLELESSLLGASLLDDASPMYVRTGVLVTNLAVHAKRGRDDLLVWVTTLADASAVESASVNVLDCRGHILASGRSDSNGLWHHRAPIQAADYCPETGLGGLFISARIAADHPQAHGQADYAFVRSDWDQGIETWRFNVPTAWESTPDMLSHSVLDRGLYRAGERVSMKHYLRVAQRDGLGIPVGNRPDRLVIQHEGSSQQYEQSVVWQASPSGGLAALSEFEIPTGAPLGTYSLRLTDNDHGWYGSTQFRVEEFRLPTFTGQLSIVGGEQGEVLVAPARMDVGVQLAWLSGGPAAGQALAVSALISDAAVQPAEEDGYSYSAPPRSLLRDAFQIASADVMGKEINAGVDFDAPMARRLFLDHQSSTLDENGTATLHIENVPAVDRPSRIHVETSYADPVGEIQTLSRAFNVWPSAVQAGLKAEGWSRVDDDIPVSLRALGSDLKPRAGVPMELLAIERRTYTVRKRLVGGFYRYDSHTERTPVATVCEGVTNGDGTLSCTLRFDHAGSYELVAVANDAIGQRSYAYTSMWVSGADDLWFGGQDDDRIEIVPAQRQWAPGDEAEFQVRMPFREATALVSVEREGVLWTRLQHLEGKQPLVRIPVLAEWGPNAYVSVLLLRGRLYEPSVRSFFEGGWREPMAWLKAFSETRDDALVTQQIDLAKPALRIGLSELKVSSGYDRLKVDVSPARDVFRVREEGVATVRVTLPDGRPAAHGTVAFVAVDEALLELAPNPSWALYDAMHPRRSLAVQTASTQLQVVGRRHYGRKAVAAGGGGGMLPTRELFDTLLSWQPMVALDANGEAEIHFQLNDSLSRFRLVAVADYGSNYFGDGQATVVTRQDMQLVSGLAPMLREGDTSDATVTVRNGTGQERQIHVRASLTSWMGEREFEQSTVRLAPGEARAVSWAFQVPELQWPHEGGRLDWRFDANDIDLADRLVVQQAVESKAPATTVQASVLSLLEGQSTVVSVNAPSTAARDAEGRVYGGLLVAAASSLTGGLQGVRDWWQDYPYTCLEQSASQAIALHDAERWQTVRNRIVSHMDADGLLKYFPGTGQGSPVLTAYVVAAVHESAQLGASFDLPAESLERMLSGLQAFAEGRIRRQGPGVSLHADEERLLAMGALARHERLAPELLASVKGEVKDWSTPAVVEWLTIMKRLPASDRPDNAQQLARNTLVARMLASGTTLTFTDEAINAAPGLMATSVTSLAGLMLAVMEDPLWKADLPRMAQGLLTSQRRGAWHITTENLMGLLALERFARHFESASATGSVRVTQGDAPARVLPLPSGTEVSSTQLPWPTDAGELNLTHDGQGRAWVSLRAQSRLELAQPSAEGYRITRRIEAVRRQAGSAWTTGDIYRVEVEIHARAGAQWVVLDDPVPAGATILGSGLGRDSGPPSHSGSEEEYAPAFVERRAGRYQAYFDYLPAGRVKLSYTVRLNAPGSFHLPPTRVEALYRSGLYGLFPNEGITVQARVDR